MIMLAYLIILRRIWDMSPIRVLIADNSKDFAEMLSDTIQISSDIEIVGIAENGPQTITLLNQTKPDVLLLDIVMPDIDGLEVLRRINKVFDDEIPAIFMISALGNEEITELAISLGARYFFTKPINLKALISKIREVKGKTEK